MEVGGKARTKLKYYSVGFLTVTQLCGNVTSLCKGAGSVHVTEYPSRKLKRRGPLREGKTNNEGEDREASEGIRRVYISINTREVGLIDHKFRTLRSSKTFKVSGAPGEKNFPAD